MEMMYDKREFIMAWRTRSPLDIFVTRCIWEEDTFIEQASKADQGERQVHVSLQTTAKDTQRGTATGQTYEHYLAL